MWDNFVSWCKADRKTWTDRLMLVQCVMWILGIVGWWVSLTLWIKILLTQI